MQLVPKEPALTGLYLGDPAAQRGREPNSEEFDLPRLILHETGQLRFGAVCASGGVAGKRMQTAGAHYRVDADGQRADCAHRGMKACARLGAFERNDSKRRPDARRDFVAWRRKRRPCRRPVRVRLRLRLTIAPALYGVFPSVPENWSDLAGADQALGESGVQQQYSQHSLSNRAAITGFGQPHRQSGVDLELRRFHEGAIGKVSNSSPMGRSGCTVILRTRL